MKKDSYVGTRYPSVKKKKLQKIADREYRSNLSWLAEDALDEVIKKSEGGNAGNSTQPDTN